MKYSNYDVLLESIKSGKKSLAILIDPDKFDVNLYKIFLQRIPKKTTHLFVGGSTVANGETTEVVKALKKHSPLPIWLFPGDVNQITAEADVLMFLSLFSGRNPEYLVGQQIKAVPIIQNSGLEILPTAYLLIDGGNTSSVARVTGTEPLPQKNREDILHTALAGQYLGSKLIYLEAGSGAKYTVHPEIVREVKSNISIPLIVGGGIKTEAEMQAIYNAGADMVVMGTAYENQ